MNKSFDDFKEIEKEPLKLKLLNSILIKSDDLKEIKEKMINFQNNISLLKQDEKQKIYFFISEKYEKDKDSMYDYINEENSFLLKLLIYHLYEKSKSKLSEFDELEEIINKINNKVRMKEEQIALFEGKRKELKNKYIDLKQKNKDLKNLYENKENIYKTECFNLKNDLESVQKEFEKLYESSKEEEILRKKLQYENEKKNVKINLKFLNNRLINFFL